RKHRDLAAIYGEAPAAVETAIEGFAKQVSVADQALRRSGYLLGGAFSAADLLLISCLDWAHAYGLKLTGDLHEYRLRIHERPAYRAAARLNFSISAGA
ncbi:MAG: glutathione S-transferase family protein, partial [Xanthomonadales bacterium]|nr:glutathione S-transferase family protein [Xanthomonadales bacterium]NIN74799.1 glutathione S-transferase family protein [Xanthomonadales bacterium]NIO13058.1 glutathione S-transferase family protein [Xanthomonadales bacterium]NIQ35400.1 glutathione S-transferase family protein [Xanthomonadales bacterium]